MFRTVEVSIPGLKNFGFPFQSYAISVKFLIQIFFSQKVNL